MCGFDDSGEAGIWKRGDCNFDDYEEISKDSPAGMRGNERMAEALKPLECPVAAPVMETFVL